MQAIERLRRTIARGALVGVLATSFVLPMTVPALAVGECDAGAICVYTSGGYWDGLPHFEAQNTISSWSSAGFGAVANADNSLKNRSVGGNRVHGYNFNWFIDKEWCISPGANQQIPADHDEKGQSHQWFSGSC